MDKKIRTIEDLAAISGTAAAELGIKNSEKNAKSAQGEADTPSKNLKGQKSFKRHESFKNQESSDSHAPSNPYVPASPTGGKKNAAKKGYEAKFFNEMDPSNWRVEIQNALNSISVKYDIYKLNVLYIERSNIPYKAILPSDPGFHDRDWVWNEKFFKKYLLSAENDNFETEWWQDMCINQISIMVWNLVRDTVIKTWKETGTYPGAENLPRKMRGSGEAVAEALANDEQNAFKELFK